MLLGNPHVLVLVVAILVRVVWRQGASRPAARQLLASAHADTIHVLVSYGIRDPWREHVTRLITTSARPIRVSLLLRCTDAQSVRERDAIDSILSPAVHIEVGFRVPSHPNALLRRLVRKFVTGDERLVVFLGADALTCIGWDEVATSAQPDCDAGSVVSCPTAALDGRARFPTLRVRSNGSIARSTSAVMEGTEGRTVASVCWCPEFTLMTGRVAQAWSRRSTESYVDQCAAQQQRDGDGSSAPHRPHLVLGRPVLEHNDRVEDDMIDFDEGSSTHALKHCELVGITRSSTGAERIQKYGDLFQARLAVQTQRERARAEH